tara:strand:- start:42796 stop:43083 length:288 start_codon:yes stop_codon:yes gene_type:complete
MVRQAGHLAAPFRGDGISRRDSVARVVATGAGNGSGLAPVGASWMPPHAIRNGGSILQETRYGAVCVHSHPPSEHLLERQVEGAVLMYHNLRLNG